MSDPHAQREPYLANALSDDERAVFEAHAQSCAECTREVEAWHSFGAALKEQLASVRRAPTRGEVAELLARAEEPRSLMPKWLVPSLVAASVAMVIGFFVLRSPSEQPWSPAVVASNGFVASADGDFATNETGHARVTLGEDELGLGAMTSVRVERAGTNGTKLVLREGTLAAHVNPARGKRNFDIETPLGRVHVVGTVFRVRSSAEALQVEVIRGVVEVESADGNRARVTAGHMLLQTKGRPSAEGDFAASEFAELSDQAPVVAPAPVDAGVEPDEVAPTKRSAPVAAWRSAAARGECATVIVAAERYVKADSGDADVWLILGDCRRRERSFEKAVQAYVAASKTREAQGKKGLLQAAALLQEELGQPQQALGLIDTFLKSKPERMLEAAALVRKARALTALGQKREAAAVLKDTVKRLPETPSAVEANRLLESL